MNDLEYDAMQKKRVAANARRKVNGSKSKKCSLASDLLSQSEIRKKHGAVMTYKIGQPITWTEFRSYPKEMQQKWLDAFTEKFHCGAGGLTVCFCVPRNSISAYLFRNKLTLDRPGQYTPVKGEAIREWLGVPVPVAAPAKPPEPSEPPKSAPPPAPSVFVNTMQSGQIQFTGTVSEIAQSLFAIFGTAQVDMKVIFRCLDNCVTEEKPNVSGNPQTPRNADRSWHRTRMDRPERSVNPGAGTDGTGEA